ncbi:hypothetical protein ADL28_23230 [Streptomyces violaceusniger]|uniref:Uncharacterized protein n=1 Tax=Streptomyces violaceusniger TaxID=68280 RepID=A0A0X3WAC5_STRVO|nr:hypothetical protein ADL28_23230 [Streptomyces violaceusniger]
MTTASDVGSAAARRAEVDGGRQQPWRGAGGEDPYPQPIGGDGRGQREDAPWKTTASGESVRISSNQFLTS